MAEFNELMSDAETGGTELTISITQKSDGTYLVEDESMAETAADGGEMGETAGTQAKSLDEALQIAKNMFDDGSGDTAAFNEGFGAPAPTMKKPGMI